MEYRNLGGSGVKVSTLCLGAMTFGEADPSSVMHGVGSAEATVGKILDRAVEQGINFIDTADVYGQDGLSERVLGGWLDSSRKRDQLVIATKFRFRMQEGPNGTGAARYRIMRAVDESLKRLRTDRIDLYQIHMQDWDTPEEETLRALSDLVRAGKVLYLGCSNYAAYRVADSQWISRTEHLERFVSMQMQYSLLARDIEREHVPVCRKYQMGILPWSPLAGGFLSGKFREHALPPPGARLTEWKERFGRMATPRNWSIVETLVSVAERHGATPSQVAIAWLLRKEAVSSVIFGARTVEQLDDNLGASKVVLSTEEVAELDAVSQPILGYPYEFLLRTQPLW